MYLPPMAIDPLAEILAELTQGQGLDRPKAKSVPRAETPAQSIDDLLASIEGKAPVKPAQAMTPPPTGQPSLSIDDLLTSIEGTTPKSQVPVIPPNLNNEPVLIPAPLITPDRHLEQELRQVAQDIEEQEKQKQRELEAQRREQLQVKAKEAQAWLKQLDRLSSEGIWFEEFAKKYPSELEAALDYLFA